MKTYLLLSFVFITSLASAAQPDEEVEVPAGKLQIYYRYDQATRIPYHPFARPEGCLYNPDELSYTILIPGSPVDEESSDSEASQADDEEDEKQSSFAQRFPRAARPAQGSLTEGTIDEESAKKTKQQSNEYGPVRKPSKHPARQSYPSEQQHVCPVCELTLCTKTVLKNHLTTHTGEKQYGCDQCGARCATIGQLNLHKRTHLEIPPFKCSECEKRSSQRHNLFRHMKREHGISLEQARVLIPTMHQMKKSWNQIKDTDQE